MFKMIACGLAALSLAMASTAHAQDQSQGRPDEGDSWKYFFFHNPGVAEEKAREDVTECLAYARNLQVIEQGSTRTYSSVPYTTNQNLNLATRALISGLTGLAEGIIGGIFNAGNRRAMERANLRRCFGFKGYKRYEMTKDEHKAFLEGGRDEVRERFVARILGPEPEGERLVP